MRRHLISLLLTMLLMLPGLCSCSDDGGNGPGGDVVVQETATDVPGEQGGAIDVPGDEGADGSDPSVPGDDISADSGGSIDEAGAWAAFLPGGGEFSKYEYRLFLWARGGKPAGQVQVYGESVAGTFKRQMKLYAVEVTAAGAKFRFAEEEEVRADLTLKSDGDKPQLVGKFQYYGGDGNLVEEKDVTFDNVGETKHCASSCPGQFCDLLAGTCKACGSAECELDCVKTEDCGDATLACLESQGTCYPKCANEDECGPNTTCIEGLCGFSEQFK